MNNYMKELVDRVENLIRIKELDKAKRICLNPDYINNNKIQLLLMEIYYIEKNNESIIEIGTREMFKNDIGIQSKLAQTYITIGRYEDALSICDRREYQGHIGFIQLKNKALRRMESKKKTNPEIYPENLNKQTKFLLYIMALARKERDYAAQKKLYQEALVLANYEGIKDDPFVLLKKVVILKKLKQYEEALEIANNEMFDNDINMLVQRVSILFQLGRYEESLKVSMDSRIVNIDNVVNIRKEIKEKMDLIQKVEEINNINTQDSQIESKEDTKLDIITILNRIKNKEIAIEDINTSSLSELCKDILLFAYYEVNNYPSTILKRLHKELLNKYSDNEEIIKIINPLRTKISGSKIFDVPFYYDLLKKNVEVNNNVLKRTR